MEFMIKLNGDNFVSELFSGNYLSIRKTAERLQIILKDSIQLEASSFILNTSRSKEI